ncbi:MAG: hypothetical protein E4H01_11405 [Lysobacterales bacterium]|nr:MAG: hypothetical protein E4H01_11405 [Xanthomonadales bacterium]
MDEPNAIPQQANRQIAKAAGTVMLAFILSNLVGVVRGIVITNAFGTSSGLDSFNAANRIAEMLFNLVAGGALGSAFIPIFTGFLTRKDHKGAWKLASGVINLVLLVLVLISILAWVFAPQIVADGLFILMRKRLGGLESGRIIKGIAQALLATGVMAVIIWGWGQLFAQRSLILNLFGALGLGLLAYALLVWFMRVPEIKSLIEIIKKRLIRTKTAAE